MRIARLGGGPAGLYIAISMKLRDPAAEVVVIERNKSDNTFGWGVVLSDETLENLAANDSVSAQAIRENFAYWDDIALHCRGEVHVSSGHGFCGIGRKNLLLLLQDRARDIGVELRFETEVQSAEVYRRDFDVVVARDGRNSKTRALYAGSFTPEIADRLCYFVWLGTHQTFAAAGGDLIDVSAGQTTPAARPVYSRMFQTPLSDRIRNGAGIRTMAAGNIYEADHANSILMAGRADLVAMGRPRLADPHWTPREAAKVGDQRSVWAKPYEAGRDQTWRVADRDAEAIRI